jgi:CheY-like chemotaxis protein
MVARRDQDRVPAVRGLRVSELHLRDHRAAIENGIGAFGARGDRREHDMNRILIAEDETRIASFLEKGLRANGFVTTVAGDGNEALALARSGRFDLMILDIGLPLADGFQVLKELRAHDSRLPVIVLTARHGVTDTVTGLEEGADDYVTKPFRFEELLARVRVRLRANGLPSRPCCRWATSPWTCALAGSAQGSAPWS